MALVSGNELKEFNAASLTGSYQTFGSTLSNPAYYMTITNTSDVDAYISTDGVSNHFRIPSGTSLEFHPQYTWSNTPSGVQILSNNAQLSIKWVTAAGTGAIIANILTER